MTPLDFLWDGGHPPTPKEQGLSQDVDFPVAHHSREAEGFGVTPWVPAMCFQKKNKNAGGRFLLCF